MPNAVSFLSYVFGKVLVNFDTFFSYPFLGKALEGKISLSLDAWTSSNCYAFLAIVAHYITNEGKCGELSISFYIYLAHPFFRRATYRFPRATGRAFR